MTDQRKKHRLSVWLWSAVRLPWLIAVGLTLLQAAGCGDQHPGPLTPGGIAAVVVAPDTLTLVAGQSHAFSATARKPDGGTIPGPMVAWSSSDTAVARVDSAGQVTALRAGQARIVATIAGKQGQAAITVQAPVASVARVEIAPAGQLDLRSGSIQQLAVRAFAEDGTEVFGRPVTWSSSDPTIAQVEPGHVLRARAVGMAAITATVEGRSATAVVRVLSQAVRIDFDRPWLTLALGEVGVIHAQARDEGGNVINKAIVWSSNNPAVATVAGAGRVTAVGYGSAILTATVEGVSAQIRVGVGTWAEHKLLSADGAPLPAMLFKVVTRDSVGTGTTTWFEARAGRLRLMGGGPGYGRYEQRFDVAVLRDGQPAEYGQLVFPGTYTTDLAGNVVVRTINDELLAARRLPDGSFAITGTGEISIAGQEVSSGLTFIYGAR